MNETIVTLVGRLAGEITRRRFSTGSITSFRMHCRERRFDAETQSWVDGDGMFVSVHCWRRLGDNAHTSLARGDRVIVVGRLYHREFEHHGRLRLSVEVDARAVGPDLTFDPVEVKRDPDRVAWRRTATENPEPAEGPGVAEKAGVTALPGAAEPSGSAPTAEPGPAAQAA
ncbi:single-stranded DNA-binding protein [Actinokineospora auranticolor]|uniref:Single-strand DNA-binding protein n=1 Tax=Actinokineospora auranticolor TaxID=155976 RepID=A0A2S6GUT4_9PSEU|nr:single-stranded DNA-binding protein [Actinokineospora auranticolor]PPK69005.1 single-strand DNA-binding protein [Actinokineospora auranticolor]